jgi:hypothetical protein
MLRTNEKKLVVTSVQGQPVYPAAKRPFSVDHQGKPFLLPSIGGITYNIKVGDSAFGWAGDHLEPGVSTMADSKDGMSALNTSFHFYACIGNRARLVSGDAKGALGTVTGHHGGAEHVMIDFPDAALKKMTMDDKILITACGQGLQLLNFPGVHCYNLDPALLHKMGLKARGAKLEVPVAAIVPGHLMGSGVGSTSMGTGDYDIMTMDSGELKKHKLDNIRLGDIVAITDHENIYGRNYKRGAISIGVVIHADCLVSGHGPGVTTIFSAATAVIVPKLNVNANIARYLKIGRYKKG